MRQDETLDDVGDRLWLPLNALRAFEAVGRGGSFTAAAAALRVSQSSLSRHVAGLEEFCGRRLLERRPQGIALTEAGAALLPVVTHAFDRIEGAMRTLRHDRGPRVLAVHMPPTFLAVVGLALLRDFRAAFADVSLDVSSSNGIGLPGRGHHVAVVFDRPVVDDLVRDLLWTVSAVPACAPALAERADAGLGAFLAGTDLLHVKVEGEVAGGAWAEFGRAQGLDLSARRALSFETEALAVQWAVGGGGVVLVDDRMWGQEFAAGRLVAPFDVRWDTGFGYYLALHPDDVADPAIALFRAFVIARFAAAET